MTPTPEQLAIIEAAVSTTDSLIINALAGAAKTTTLELICKALPVQPILSLAFNKRIADEMAKRLPGHVKCATLNSVGHGVWSSAISRRQMRVDSKKSFTLLKEWIEQRPKRSQGDYFAATAEILGLARQMKTSGFIPRTFSGATGLISQKDFYDALEEIPDDTIIEAAEAVLGSSIRAAYDGFIDFDDQLYMPTLFGGSWPRFPLVLVDEAQDLSPLNHAMLRKLVPSRLIAVGDPWQSIYGFRGAVHNGMRQLKDTFSMRELTLSVSFRCPKRIVTLANRRVPHMKAAEWAKEGHFEVLHEWDASSIPDGSAILCRNNAPLFKLALRLIAAGRGVELVGADIGPSLIKVLKKLGNPALPQSEVFIAINRWEAEALKKAKKPGTIGDRAECLRVFASEGPTLQAAISYAEHLFASRGPIQLLSGHKAKGLEWDTVYHLDPWRIPSQYCSTPEELEQELNCRYVITTRAKTALYEVNMENFRAPL